MIFFIVINVFRLPIGMFSLFLTSFSMIDVI